MRLTLPMLMLFVTLFVSGQEKEVSAIKERVKLFSANLMAGKKKEVVEMYTKDGKIFPMNREILEGEELSEYWNPSNPSDWKTTYHKVTPVEIKILGNEAYDYGHYEGSSTDGTSISKFQGKYVIVWKKVEGVWKIYLDIWNPIKK